MSVKNKHKAVKTIKRSNAAFAKLPKNKQRVAVAKDVLRLIDSKLITATNNRYVAIDGYSWGERGLEFQDVAQEKDLRCNVCALGAIMVADVCRRDKAEIADMSCIDNKDIYTRMRGIFPKKDLQLIEWAFEGRDWGELEYSTSVVKYRALEQKVDEFRRKHRKGRHKLLRAIMENIIEHDGTFTLN
jgi:hypothetical protein